MPARSLPPPLQPAAAGQPQPRAAREQPQPRPLAFRLRCAAPGRSSSPAAAGQGQRQPASRSPRGGPSRSLGRGLRCAACDARPRAAAHRQPQPQPASGAPGRSPSGGCPGLSMEAAGPWRRWGPGSRSPYFGAAGALKRAPGPSKIARSEERALGKAWGLGHKQPHAKPTPASKISERSAGFENSRDACSQVNPSRGARRPSVDSTRRGGVRKCSQWGTPPSLFMASAAAGQWSGRPSSATARRLARTHLSRGMKAHAPSVARSRGEDRLIDCAAKGPRLNKDRRGRGPGSRGRRTSRRGETAGRPRRLHFQKRNAPSAVMGGHHAIGDSTVPEQIAWKSRSGSRGLACLEPATRHELLCPQVEVQRGRRAGGLASVGAPVARGVCSQVRCLIP
ncbi:unnamed protein product [Prorocentrum cordatum]|uniref:Uncharacterized protein n=1 Tax=Prorocentrum cordatum TaxID=2364126 RepID=A0ABN9X7X0_9DINO|nr:unnamed protein product [Polarella glacialis]